MPAPVLGRTSLAYVTQKRARTRSSKGAGALYVWFTLRHCTIRTNILGLPWGSLESEFVSPIPLIRRKL